MATPVEPMSGRSPKIPPIFEPRRWVALRNAPTGPVRMARPKAISPMTPQKPRPTTKIRNGTRNAKPPYWPTRYGKSQMQPMPTAEPMQLMMKPKRLRKASREELLLAMKVHLFFNARQHQPMPPKMIPRMRTMKVTVQ